MCYVWRRKTAVYTIFLICIEVIMMCHWCKLLHPYYCNRHWTEFTVFVCELPIIWRNYGLGWNMAQVWLGHCWPRGRYEWWWISCTSPQRQWIVHGTQYTSCAANSCLDTSTKWWISKVTMFWSKCCCLCHHSCYYLMSLLCFWNFLLLLWWENLQLTN